MKNVTHIDRYVQDYLDGELEADQLEQVETHLASCLQCLERVHDMRNLADAISTLPGQIEPPLDLWPDVEMRISEVLDDRVGSYNGTVRGRHAQLKSISGHQVRPPTTGLPVARSTPAEDSNGPFISDDPLPAKARRRRRLRLRPAAAAAVVVAVFAVVLWTVNAFYSDSWDVERLAGAPQIADALLTERGAMRAGDWLTTDGASRARLRAGIIGDVEVNRNTRLQLRRTDLSDHRISLESGSIHARIWAPPRLFIVETPAATAVDLGCIYSLAVDSAGRSILRVESGYVELQRDGRTRIVPAGAMCIADSERGPGTAFAEDTSPRLRAALERYDFSGASAEDLTIVLAEARTQDALTLWQLLERADRDRRVRIYDRLTELVDAPPGASRNGVIAGTSEEMRMWRRHLGLEALTWTEYAFQKLAFWRK